MKISKTHHRTKNGIIKKNPVSSKSRERLLIEHINSHAWIPIKDFSFAEHLMKERMKEEYYNDSIWRFLSKDTKSKEVFEKPIIDVTYTVIFVDIWYARFKKGNPLEGSSGKSVEGLMRKIKSGIKMDGVPDYDLRTGKVEEGNHRVEALYRLGYKSVPMIIHGGW